MEYSSNTGAITWVNIIPISKWCVTHAVLYSWYIFYDIVISYDIGFGSDCFNTIYTQMHIETKNTNVITYKLYNQGIILTV